MKVIAIFIALNAEKTLPSFYEQFPKNLVNNSILVDDHSDDRTFEIAKKLGITSYRNKTRLGYGGNLKKALRLALKMGADIIVDLHPDGEYKSDCIAEALDKIKKGNQFILGNRFYRLNEPLKNGMHIWKFVPILFLNFIDRLILRVTISDFHQGFRVYTKKMLQQIDLDKTSDGYLFSFQLIVESIKLDIPIAQVPIQTRYIGKKRGASVKNSIKYSLGTFRVLSEYLREKYLPKI